MPFRTIKYTIAPPLTQASVLAGMKEVLSQLGYTTPVDTYNAAGIEYVVYQVVVNGSTKGTVYLRFQVGAASSGGALGLLEMADGWNAGTHASTGSTATISALTTYGSTTQSSLVLYGFSSDNNEGNFFIPVLESTTGVPSGWMRPANKAAWYDENTYRFIFCPTNTGWSTSWTTAAGITTAQLQARVTSSTTRANNLQFQKRPIYVGPRRLVITSIGEIGYFSGDFAEVAPSGLPFGAPVVDPDTGQTYVLVTTSSTFVGLKVVT